MSSSSIVSILIQCMPTVLINVARWGCYFSLDHYFDTVRYIILLSRYQTSSASSKHSRGVGLLTLVFRTTSKGTVGHYDDKRPVL